MADQKKLFTCPTAKIELFYPFNAISIGKTKSLNAQFFFLSEMSLSLRTNPLSRCVRWNQLG
jgi:hypothetical protein